MARVEVLHDEDAGGEVPRQIGEHAAEGAESPGRGGKCDYVEGGVQDSPPGRAAEVGEAPGLPANGTLGWVGASVKQVSPVA